MRCDLHVHTVHSGMCTVPVARRFCRESFSRPLEVYEILKGAGMDLVTVTDHDSMAAHEDLSRFPDFFPSEEVSVTMPSGTEAHIAVYGLNAAQHQGVQERRDDLPRFLAYLTEERLLFGANHIFSALTGRRHRSDFDWFERHFPVWETRNGAMEECVNQLAAEVAGRSGKPITAGSDSHTTRTLARTYTEVAGARSASEFLDGLRSGRGRAAGVSGDWTRVTLDVATIASRMFLERPWTVLLLPFTLGIPVTAFFNSVRERRFAAYWAARLAGAPPSGVMLPVAETA
ncbi:MAG: PHP-associated domain-containing protein [Bryobacteraceae bacterium]